MAVKIYAGCTLGLLLCYSTFGYILEYLTRKDRLNNTKITEGKEFCILAWCCVLYAMVSFVGKVMVETKGKKVPWMVYISLSVSTFLSTYCSILALRHVSYPTKVLGKTCKPIPVMVMGALFGGKTYSCRKYASIVTIMIGVVCFMYGQVMDKSSRGDRLGGLLLLLISLLLDGITGALEDRFIKRYSIRPFQLMFGINVNSVLISMLLLLGSKPMQSYMISIWEHPNVWRYYFGLGLSGGLGQMLIFYTINRFGALPTSVIGSLRKMITILLSIYLFGHQFVVLQYFGLSIVAIGMMINLVRKKSTTKHDDAIMEKVEFLAPSPKTTPTPFNTTVDAAFRATTSV